MANLCTILRSSAICKRLEVKYWKSIVISQNFHNAQHSYSCNRIICKKIPSGQNKDEIRCMKETTSPIASNVQDMFKISTAMLHQNCSKHCSQYKRQVTKQTKKSTFSGNRPMFSGIYERKMIIEKKVNAFFNQYSAQELVNRAPDTIRPYLQLARVDKPIGTLLLFFPCAFSICLAAPRGEFPSLYYLGLFGVGAFLMRGAGCVINDLWDRDLDKLVDRTKERPIASGKVSPTNAIKLLAGQLTASLAILLSLNSTCILMGFAAMIPVVLYPLAKRYTYFPQVVLGLTFNVGALMGYTAVTGHACWPIIGTLYASCLCWTLYYDTIYAFQDIEDDEKSGIKSMALLFNKFTSSERKEMLLQDRLKTDISTRRKIRAFLIATMGSHLILLLLAGSSKCVDGPIFLASIINLFLATDNLNKWDTSSRQASWELFNRNKWHGFILTLGIIGSIYSQGKPL